MGRSQNVELPMQSLGKSWGSWEKLVTPSSLLPGVLAVLLVSFFLVSADPLSAEQPEIQTNLVMSLPCQKPFEGLLESLKLSHFTGHTRSL